MIAEKCFQASAIVAQYWEGNAPEWVKRLATFCDEESQAAAARKIGRSASLVNQVLKNKYTGDLNAVQQRVEAALKDEGVMCPVLGNIAGDVCLKQQRQPYSSANHVAVRLFKACRNCPHNLKNKGATNVRD